MVNFGLKLIENKYLPWSSHYIDYELLKRSLEEHSNSNGSLSSSASHNVVQAHGTESSGFLPQLFIQTEKVSLFVMQEMGRISLLLADCRHLLTSCVHNATAEDLEKVEGDYVNAGESILRLIQFVELNVTAFRKILKKHDKISRLNLSVDYLALTSNNVSAGLVVGANSRRRSRYQRFIGEPLDLVGVGNQLMQLLLQGDSISAVAVAYEAGVEELWQLQRDLEAFPKIDQSSRSNTLPNLTNLDGLDGYTDSMVTRTSFNSNMSQGNLQNLHGSLSPRRSFTSTGQILIQIHVARGRLRQTNDFVKLLAVPMMSVANEEAGVGSQYRPNKASNVLNLLSTFFYMANYYIVAPTSATYADKLGSDSSIASIIIGMTAFAALGSTILYSYWTSYSYKSALVFASACSALGNLLYSFGLPFQSLTLVMLGRLLTGFGSARSINRRYIADTFSFADRTAASASFVTASALGMAMGPFVAAILHMLTESSSSVYWQPENAPGWFMFTAWLTYLVALIWKFEDPPRRQRITTDDIREKEQSYGKTENASLLQSGRDADQSEDDGGKRLIPVIFTLVVYMVLKMILEAVLSSEANLTALYFGWKGNIMGLHLMLLSLLILPINFGVVLLARSYFDRELILGLLVAMFGGCLVIYQYQDNLEDYKLSQYLVGSAVLFVCASALEAPNMSLLSKVIPNDWSRGIINVGLLATESGTFGRVVGDTVLAAMANKGMDTMLNEAFGTFGTIVGAMIFVGILCYQYLVPTEGDE